MNIRQRKIKIELVSKILNQEKMEWQHNTLFLTSGPGHDLQNVSRTGPCVEASVCSTFIYMTVHSFVY